MLQNFSKLLIACSLMLGMTSPHRVGKAAFFESSAPAVPLEITQPSTSIVRRVNAPYSADRVRISDSAIFWFGRITASENYADVRIGYTNTQLVIRFNIIDRLLWHDTTPTAAELSLYDAVSVFVSTDGNFGAAPDLQDFRLVAMSSSSAANPAAQAAYRGNGSGWEPAAITFTATSGWRGEGRNNMVEDRGWSQELMIPFTSLGLGSTPDSQSVWGLAVILHDRDDAAGTPIAVKTWPEAMNSDQPATWAQLAFGLPTFEPPATPASGSVTIREGFNGAQVPDAAVGGTIDNLCPGNSNYIWNGWGNANFAQAPRFNLQNQSDVSDWPCFAKYYVSFPLTQVPPGKTILSATLTMHQWGGSDPTQAERSLIQVFTVAEEWAEAGLTWNNAPMAVENVSRTWANVVNGCQWPCEPRVWDVSRAVSQFYESGGAVMRLALYEADAAYHSGKYFIASEEPAWNAVARPTLTIVWGERISQLSLIITPPAPQTGQDVHVQLHFSGTGEPLNLINQLPAGLGAPTGLFASTGTIQYEASTHSVIWNGSPQAGQPLQLNFSSIVIVDGLQALTSSASLAGPSGVQDEVQTTIVANGETIYLPFTIR